MLCLRGFSDRLLEKLLRDSAAEFVVEEKYSETLAEIEDCASKIGESEREQGKIQVRINEIERKLSETAKGAGKINDYVRLYFGNDTISVETTADDKFKLSRSGKEAKNLSEGEKGAIAFAYFMARLEDKNTNLAVTTVFIDDPVCSFDCNHLFHSYALIKNKLAEAQQLIISTHNFEFFNLIRDWFKPAKSEASFYLIEKGHNGQLEAKLSEMPSLLLKFKSEYHFLFSILHRFSQNPTSDYNYLYILPNLVRRYLEAFLGFKTPICAGLKKKLPRLITDSVEHEKVLKFIDEYSHNKSLPRSLNFPDFSECRDVVAIVLRAVEAKDKEHYDALVDEINSE